MAKKWTRSRQSAESWQAAGKLHVPGLSVAGCGRCAGRRCNGGQSSAIPRKPKELKRLWRRCPHHSTGRSWVTELEVADGTLSPSVPKFKKGILPILESQWIIRCCNKLRRLWPIGYQPVQPPKTKREPISLSFAFRGSRGWQICPSTVPWLGRRDVPLDPESPQLCTSLAVRCLRRKQCLHCACKLLPGLSFWEF